MKVVRHNPEESRPSCPYTPAVEIVADGLCLLFVSGQGTRDPKTGERVLGDISLQARATVAVTGLPGGQSIEVDAVAAKSGPGA